MSYDRELADRMRELLAGQPGVTEKAMFGGLAFLIGGNMAVSVCGQGGLLLRVDPERSAAYLKTEHVTRMSMRGREMDGWLRVAPEGIRTRRQLERWVKIGVEYACSLPPKRPKR